MVWRNWELVPLERLAAVLGASPAQIRRLGRRMGLEGPPHVTDEVRKRSSITVIRRNWHLLPYEQLLELLGWTPDQLAYALREDDFLYVKLGNLKPRCAPVRFSPSDAAMQQRERALAEILRRELPAATNGAHEPLFAFVKDLATPSPSRQRTPTETPARPALSPRFCYSYFALYGDPLLDAAADPYPDGLLARLAASGVDGVWLQAVLYKLAPFPWDASLSERRELRLENLRNLVTRARRHGIGIWLYLNEPRAMPRAFHRAHPGLEGVVEGDYAALCTSVPAVSSYLRDAVSLICSQVPDVAGFFTITASENLTNCWSHHAGQGCPRCAGRSPAEVIAEVNGALAEGIRTGSSHARLIAWDWGWADSWAADAVNRLPADVALMSVSEWSTPIARGGVPTTVGEYSISTIGPGPRARSHWAIARKRGLRVLAKIQAGNTWELSAVPYIPALRNVAQHIVNLRSEGVDGLMLGWTLGGYPSPNLEVVAAIGQAEDFATTGAVDRALLDVAQRRFGPVLAPDVVAAWTGFSQAFSEFPFDGSLVYNAPMQAGPSNPLWSEPTGYRATMVGLPYDDLDGWRGVYPPEIFVGQFAKVAEGFERAVALLRDKVQAAAPTLDRRQRTAVAGELRVAEAAALHFRSTANQARFVLLRRALNEQNPSSQPPELLIRELEGILKSEIAAARRLYALQREDSRLGFEASNQYFFVPGDLAEKILNCQDLLRRWLPSQSRSRPPQVGQ